MKSRVRCMICNSLMKEVTNSHLKYKHNMTVSEYRNLFPGSPLVSDETMAMHIENLKGKRTGKDNPFYGKHHTEQTKKRIKDGNLAFVNSLTKEERSLMYGSFGDKHPSKNPEVVRKITKTLRERGVYKRTSERMKNDNPMKRPEVVAQFKGDKNPACRPEVRRKIKKALKEVWNNLSKKEKEERARKVMDACQLKPNKAEFFLDQIIQTLIPNEFRYVGDGEVIIAGKCPDWINCNGKKQIIELFGDYWHRNDDGSERIKMFSKFGFSTLIIWEHELESLPNVITRLVRFINPENKRNLSLPYFKVERMCGK